MVGLEFNRAVVDVGVQVIYIPLWLDFKVGCLARIAEKHHHLHSSMDGFLGTRRDKRRWRVSIYIPIWIDLRGTN
jgi:hypothetical protein